MKKIFLEETEKQEKGKRRKFLKKTSMLLAIGMLLTAILPAKAVCAAEDGTQTIKLILVDEEFGDALSGGKFTLAEKINDSYENIEGKTEIVVPAEGYDLGRLNAGEYRLTEIQQPAGYVMGTEPIEFRVTDEGVTIVNETNAAITPATDSAYELVVYNALFHVAMPSTGGTGTLPYSVGGLCLMATALISGFVLFKKKTAI